MATSYTFTINQNGEDQTLTLAKQLCNWTNFIGILNERLSIDNNKTNYSIHYFDKEKNRKYLVEAQDFENLLISLDDMKQTQVTIYYGQDNDNLVNGWVFAPELNQTNIPSDNTGNDKPSDYATTFHEWGKLMDKHHELVQSDPYISMLTGRFSHALTLQPNVAIISSLDQWLTHYAERNHSAPPSSHGRKQRRDFIASLPQDIGDYLMASPHPGRGRHHHHHHHHHHQRGPYPPSPPSGGPFEFWSNLFNNFGPPSSSSQEKSCSNEKGKNRENPCSGPFTGEHPFGGWLGMSKHCKKAMKMRMKDYYLQQLQQQQQRRKSLSCYTTSNCNEHESTSDSHSSSSSSSSSSSDSSDNENEKQSFRDKNKNNKEFSPRMQAKFWKSFAKQYRREHAFDGYEHIKHHKKRHGRRHHRHSHHPAPPHQAPSFPFGFGHHPHPPFPGFELDHHHHRHQHMPPPPPPPPGYMEASFSQMNLGDSKKR
ncbi:hypothetical protein BJ944DRAFT_264179 [Cunninghamella echinulata]|nr:hypothetical protein BJ944DRAFT_264179 [Cunninghamella echinulata]